MDVVNCLGWDYGSCRNLMQEVALQGWATEMFSVFAAYI